MVDGSGAEGNPLKPSDKVGYYFVACGTRKLVLVIIFNVILGFVQKLKRCFILGWRKLSWEQKCTIYF